MAPFVAAPDPSSLLPPFLACLPLAFCSSQPPPALLPFLSPILRQRVQYLSGTTAEGSWLPLLSWDQAKASDLVRKIESTTFEPHPVSGEIELGEVEAPLFRRQDEETLHSVLKLPDWELMVVYVWCEHDEPGGGPGWRVTELRLFNHSPQGYPVEWADSVGKANTQFAEVKAPELQPREPSPRQLDAAPMTQTNGQDNDDDDDDDDYWAQYDNTPGRTPATKRSPAPFTSMNDAPSHGRTASEEEYLARYGGVQPEMEHHDPSMEHEVVGESTLRGNELTGQRQQDSSVLPPLDGHSLVNGRDEPVDTELVHTRPSTSSSASAVQHLEHAAENQSHSDIAIQQHIGTSIKSLWRLARGTGIDTAEFKQVVRNELDLLDLLEQE
jgi:hypothetical protein